MGQVCLRSACEVLRVSELQVQAEQEVQRLDPAAVNRDVQQAADGVGVLGRAAVQTGGGQLQAAQQLLQLARPLLHQAVDVRHRADILNAGRGFGAVQGADALHPAVHRPRVRLRTGDARHLLQLQGGRRGTHRGRGRERVCFISILWLVFGILPLFDWLVETQTGPECETGVRVPTPS